MPDRPLTLVSHHLCPYVQRAAIALREKAVPFARRHVDLAARPDWFRALSPLGKVPLLIVGEPDGHEAVLFESAVICEYLEDTRPGLPLHPADPLTRARHRAWIEFSAAILADLWGFETARDAAGFEAKRGALITKFRRLEGEVSEGPFFAGERFSLVDAAFAPVFRYFDVFDAIAPTGVLDELPRVGSWRRTLAARPSVREAVTADYADRLHAFLRHHGAWLLRRPS